MTSRRAGAVVEEGEIADTVTLDLDQRHRRRLRLVADAGLPFLLDLPEPRHLRDGDRLRLDDGTILEVRAAREPVMEASADEPAALARLAWHLGNRHTPVQILDGRLRLRRDHVLAEMLRRLGAVVREVEAPFDPETGAYDFGPGHHHAHG